LIQQKKQLESVIKHNHKAFSLDGHIGEYSDIKYSIKLQPDVEPVSMAHIMHLWKRERISINRLINGLPKELSVNPIAHGELP